MQKPIHADSEQSSVVGVQSRERPKRARDINALNDKARFAKRFASLNIKFGASIKHIFDFQQVHPRGCTDASSSGKHAA
jgi:hypothetical protein